MTPKFSAFLSWANHGWPAIGLQTVGGLLMVLGIGSVMRAQWGDFLLGPVFALVGVIIGERYVPVVGWMCIVISLLLLILTLPAQRRQYERLRRDEAMLKRQDWRK